MTIAENWTDQVIRFWFEEVSPGDWFRGGAALDQTIRTRFLPLYEQVSAHADEIRLGTGRDALAAVIVLDQFPRNLFRGLARAFATDAKALSISQQAINAGLDSGLTTQQRVFLYMPFQHAEDRVVQARSIELYTALGDAATLNFAQRHRAVIDRFGRFPHRNAVIGRASSAEEQDFLHHNPGF